MLLLVLVHLTHCRAMLGMCDHKSTESPKLQKSDLCITDTVLTAYQYA